MSDLGVLLIVVVFWLLSYALVRFAERLSGSGR
jgi:hypothetical protein